MLSVTAQLNNYLNVCLVLWQAQHLVHLEMVFVYAAAPADTPTPIQSQQS